MLKKSIKFFTKFGLAISLIYWLVTSGKIDFNLLATVFRSPLNIAIFISVMLFVIFLTSLRWKIILEQKSNSKLSVFPIFKLSWIGIFFNSVLPGAVSGDLIKVFYVKDVTPELSKKFLFTSVFFDRIMGLFGLITVGGFFSIINYKPLSILSPSIKKLMHINILFFLIVIASIAILFVAKDLPHAIAKPFRDIKIIGNIVRKLEVIWNDLCLFRNKILIILAYSIAVQGIAMILFWFIVHPYADGDFPFAYTFSLSPLGFISIALPIAPAGLGVGHAVFQNLFELFGIKNGASLFNIYFFLVIITNLTGAIPYLLHKKVSIKEIKEDSSI